MSGACEIYSSPVEDECPLTLPEALQNSSVARVEPWTVDRGGLFIDKLGQPWTQAPWKAVQGSGLVQLPVPDPSPSLEISPHQPSPKTSRPIDSNETNVSLPNFTSSVFSSRLVNIPQTKHTKMKSDELKALAPVLGKDFKTVEPHLLALDKHLVLRTYIDGYQLGENDKAIWVALRSNRAAMPYILKGAVVNLLRWFTYVEATHPEIQESIKATEAEKKKKVAAASKAGGNFNLNLQGTENGVVTRFLPEPS